MDFETTIHMSYIEVNSLDPRLNDPKLAVIYLNQQWWVLYTPDILVPIYSSTTPYMRRR